MQQVSTLVLIICQIKVLLVIIAAGQKKEVCFKDVGCFPTGAPWSSIYRPVPPPQGPNVVKVFFLLYTRENPVKPSYIYGDTKWNVNGTDYNSQKPTILFVHGYKNSTNGSWIQITSDALLKNNDANVIFVDYGSIKNQDYFQASSNARVVGVFCSKFLEYLIHDKGAKPSTFHLIGFSLGAHIVGYVGKRIPGIARITGLEPSGILFEGFSHSEKIRVNKGDAEFVDIVHTNSPRFPIFGLGYVEAIGDVDFFFNGGSDQPGCITDALKSVLNGNLNLVKFLGSSAECPHFRPVAYIQEASRNTNCTFWGIKRNGFDTFLGKISGGWLSHYLKSLSKCTIKTCLPFGHKTLDFPARGSFDISTAATPPFCVNSSKTDNLMDELLDTYNKQQQGTELKG